MLCFQIFTSAEPQPLQQPPRSVSPGHLWHLYAYRGQPQLQLPGLSPRLGGSHGQVSNSKKQLGYRPEKQTYCKIEIPAKLKASYTQSRHIVILMPAGTDSVLTWINLYTTFVPFWASKVYIVKSGSYLATGMWHNNHPGELSAREQTKTKPACVI